MDLDEQGLEIPAEPGRRQLDSTYWCNCERICHGVMKRIPQGTWYDHRKWRDGQAAAVRSSRSVRGVQRNSIPAQDVSNGGVGGGILDEDTAPAARAELSHPPDLTPTPEESPMPPALAAAQPFLEPNLSGTVNIPAPAEPDDAGPTLASLADLQLALDYIEALKNSKLEDSGLDPSVLHRLREPIAGFLNLDDDSDLKLSVKLYLALGRASQGAYNAAREAFMEWASNNDKSCDLLSYSQIQAKVQELSSVVPIVHDMCVNTCQAYTGPLAEDHQCRECLEPRWEERNGKQVPRQTFYTLPIGSQLQAFWRSEESARLMSWRAEATEKLFEQHRAVEPTPPAQSIPRGHSYEDFIHGSDYLRAVVEGKIKPEDTVLVFSTDGAQLYQHKASDCWIYIWVIMNLPAGSRYKKCYVIPGGFIPGPNNPKNFDSFFFPGLQHLVALQKEGGVRIWNPLTQSTFTSNLFLLHETSDGPGLCHLNGLTGHNGCAGCRGYVCPIHGRRFQNSHYYPALLKPIDPLPKGSDHPDVDLASLVCTTAEIETRYEANLQVVLQSQNMNQYRIRRRDTGISKPALASGISPSHRLGIPGLFPSDTMHLTGLLVTEHMVSLFRGTIECHKTDDKSTWDWVVLTGDFWDAHGEQVDGFRRFLPGSFDRPPRNPAKKINSGYKAREYLSYVYGYLPGLLYNVLPLRYWQHFCKLVRGIKIILQHSITPTELQTAWQLLTEFCVDFEVLYVQRKACRIHFVHQSIHNLFHLAPDTHRCGPLAPLAQWTIERAIGYLGEEVKQPSNPYKNLSERGLRRAQVNALLAMCPDLSEHGAPPVPRSSVVVDVNLVLMHPKDNDKKAIAMSFTEKRALSQFCERTVHASLDLNSNIVCHRWGRLLLPSLQIARTHWKESMKSPDADLRTSRMIKFQISGKQFLGEVMYFFEVPLNGADYAVAMVSVCDDADSHLMELSYNVLWVTKWVTGQNLFAINVRDIKSVVSLLPFSQKPGHHVLFEDFGLDVAYLNSHDFSLEGGDTGQ